MEIKLINEEVTYKKTTTTKTYDVNGKEVRVYFHDMYDEWTGDYDNDYNIDDKDKEQLTDEELEELEDLI